MMLTDRYVQAAKCADDRRTDYPDQKTRGLVLRVTPSGVKSWSLRYRRKSDGKRQRITIGGYPAYSLNEARRVAIELLGKVARGEDPAKEKKRPSPEKPRTFGELAKLYKAQYAIKKRTGGEDGQMLDNDLLPALEGEPLGSIKRADIAAVLNAIIERGSPIRANRVLAVIRKVFNWAIDQGYMETTPLFRMKPPSEENSRERTLSDHEVRIFWRRLPLCHMEWEMRMLLKIALVTGQRVSEIAHAKREDVNLVKCEWFIPGGRSKNKRGHLLPLSPMAVRLFEKAMARSNDQLILPSPTNARPFPKSAPAKRMARAHGFDDHGRRTFKDIFEFTERATPHDLRRTLGTNLGALGFSRLIQDKVLNHITGNRKISAVYDRYEYLKEKRQALEAWADHLTAIVFRSSARPAVIIRRERSRASPWSRG